jgi:hypothetical protein
MAAPAVGVRKQLAFYGSAPAYRKVLELHGWGDLHTDLHRLSKQGRWDAMGGALFDDGTIDWVLPAFPGDLPEDVAAAVLEEVRVG